MSKVEATQFFDLLRQSRLVDEPTLAQWMADHQPNQSGEASDAVATRLVDDGLITRWQADNLLNGKHKGFRLGSYRLLRKLGRGGMSTVYLAKHELMRRSAAIKVLPRRRVGDSSYLARFHREAQAAAALDHPNIVRIYDVAADGPVHYIAMEYIEGQDLQSMVAKDGRLDALQAADFIAQSAIGLQHAHEMGLVHRDIKPANLLANPKGVVKILDMGLAKFENEQDDSSLTVQHAENVLGTVDYLAPEQARDSHNVDSRADIYSLGCTLYFLLTGHAPFPTGSAAQRLVKHVESRPASILEERPDAPKLLVQICEQMMEKKPENRMQTADEVADLLGSWLASQGQHVTTDSGTGSRIGLSAATVRELTRQNEQQNDIDTKIARAEDETQKSSAVGSPIPIIQDDLELAPLNDGTAEPNTKQSEAQDADGQGTEDPHLDLEQLQGELSDFPAEEDMLTTPVRTERKLATATEESDGLPVWAWFAIGGGLLLTIVVGVIVIMNNS